ncbi:MAG: hypothetical protein QW791_08305 [Candidatus Bathyarchaeia archaeon]
MGIILDYAKMRLKDIEVELDRFFDKPIDYVLQKQTLRKALLLEWLDNFRPIIGTKYEHWVQREVKG